MALIGKEIADEHNVPVRMSVKYFSIGTIGKKLLGSFSDPLAFAAKSDCAAR